MKKTTTLTLLALLAMPSWAQTNGLPGNIDTREDTTDIVTISDIINEQQKVTTLSHTQRHYTNVWSRRGYFNISYNTATLTPKDDIPTGIIETGVPTSVPEFKSDWGVSIQLGRSYRLHKKPIANTALFCIDFTGIDLNVNHFKKEPGAYLYTSSYKDQDGKFATPWLLEKYEANYGLSLGPSLTIAPFNYINGVAALHYLKFQVYYRVGYHISAAWMQNDKKLDQNDGTANNSSNDKKLMEDNLKMDWGHGLTKTFGAKMSWKGIGVGYEHRTAKLEYKPVTTGDFGSKGHDFDMTTNRVYISFCTGR